MSPLGGTRTEPAHKANLRARNGTVGEAKGRHRPDQHHRRSDSMASTRSTGELLSARASPEVNTAPALQPAAR